MPAPRVTPNTPPLPHSGSSDGSPTIRPQRPEFVFAVCQRGAENALKSHLIREDSPLKLAFSRPGLVTFKVADQGEFQGQDAPSGPLIRQYGCGLGHLRGNSANQLAQQAIDLAGQDWDAVHVFSRDESLPGHRGFEPGQTELDRAVTSIFADLLPQAACADTTPAHARVLDIILVEPNQWLVGSHTASHIAGQWPGGVLPIQPPAEVISRAYLKMAEALAWSRMPVEANDEIVEIGSSPGGASQRLLDLGLRVTGIDPAEMDSRILQHPRFEHWRGKSSAIKRKRYSRFRWLAADANVAPNYTLDAIEDIATYPTSRFEGLLLTLKLSSYDLLAELDHYLARIRDWGFSNVEARQLSFNRQELCVAALR